MKSQALDLINRWSWFRYVPEEGKSWFAGHCRLTTVDKAAVVYRHNDEVTHVYGVVTGALRIYVASAAGEEMTLEEVAPGTWFPHFQPQERPTYFGNCSATKAATLVAIAQQDFSRFGELWPQFYRGLYSEFAARGVVTIGRLELLTLHSLNVRLAVYLLRLLVVRGKPEPGGVYFIESTDSQGEIANRVGGARQRINSVLKKWERQSVISIERNGLMINDADFLLKTVRDSGFDVEAYLGAWQGGWKSPFHQGSGLPL